MPGQEEAEIPVLGGVGVQSGESYLCTPGGTGNGKVCQQQDKHPPDLTVTVRQELDQSLPVQLASIEKNVSLFCHMVDKRAFFNTVLVGTLRNCL